MPITKIPGDVVDIQISTVLDPATAVFKKLVCGTNLSLAGSSDTDTVNTKCGTLKSRTPTSWTAEGEAMANATPGPDELSINEVIDLYQNNTQFLVKIANLVDEEILYRGGQGFFAAYSENYNVDGNVGFDYTIEIDGSIDTVATP